MSRADGPGDSPTDATSRRAAAGPGQPASIRAVGWGAARLPVLRSPSCGSPGGPSRSRENPKARIPPCGKSSHLPGQGGGGSARAHMRGPAAGDPRPARLPLWGGSDAGRSCRLWGSPKGPRRIQSSSALGRALCSASRCVEPPGSLLRPVLAHGPERHSGRPGVRRSPGWRGDSGPNPCSPGSPDALTVVQQKPRDPQGAALPHTRADWAAGRSSHPPDHQVTSVSHAMPFGPRQLLGSWERPPCGHRALLHLQGLGDPGVGDARDRRGPPPPASSHSPPSAAGEAPRPS